MKALVACWWHAGGMSLSSWWLWRWCKRWAAEWSAPPRCQVPPAEMALGHRPGNALKRGGGQSKTSLLTVVGHWCLSLCTITVICCYTGNVENTGDEMLYFCKEGAVQRLWVPGTDTKLVCITLPVPSSHEAPKEKCHSSSRCQRFGTLLLRGLAILHRQRCPAGLWGHRQHCCCCWGAEARAHPFCRQGQGHCCYRGFSLHGLLCRKPLWRDGVMQRGASTCLPHFWEPQLSPLPAFHEVGSFHWNPQLWAIYILFLERDRKSCESEPSTVTSTPAPRRLRALCLDEDTSSWAHWLHTAEAVPPSWGGR